MVDAALKLRIFESVKAFFFLWLSLLIRGRPAQFEMCYLDLECKCFVHEEEGSARSLKATSFWLMSFEMALQEQ